jgi:excisionase family DNA binding protein
MAAWKKPVPTPKLCFSVVETANAIGVCVDLIYDAVREGRLVAKRFGNRILIPATELQKFIDGLPAHDLVPTDAGEPAGLQAMRSAQ